MMEAWNRDKRDMSVTLSRLSRHVSVTCVTHLYRGVTLSRCPTESKVFLEDAKMMVSKARNIMPGKVSPQRDNARRDMSVTGRVVTIPTLERGYAESNTPPAPRLIRLYISPHMRNRPSFLWCPEDRP